MNLHLGRTAVPFVLAAGSPLPDPTIPLLCLVGTLLVGTVALIWIARRYKQPAEPEPEHNRLAFYRQMLQEGALKPEEFDRITRLADEKPQPSITAQRPGSQKQQERGLEES